MSAYLDAELGIRSAARIERHAGECPECRRLLEGLRRMLAVLQGLQPQADRVDALALALAAAVRQRLDEPPAKR